MAQPQPLNLNNEVVKMRKEVKKVRVLTIRRLTRHIAKLKAKKGSEDAVLKNHKRAQRLLEEIHAMKEVKLDQVTKLALATEINFELVCKKPNCTATDRAIARLTTHPLLKTKIADIKAAVKAFKDARRKPAKVTSSEGQKLEEPLTKQSEATQHSSSSVHNKTYKQLENQDKIEVKEDTDMGKNLTCEKLRTADSEEKCPSDDFTLQSVDHDKLIHQRQKEKTLCPEGNKYLGGILSSAVDESDSDASQTEETGTEKEYFDDSTEERFCHQSSGSEESDSDDDFFIGKIKRAKKRGTAGTVERVKNMPPKKTQGSEYDTMQDTKDGYPSSKAVKLQSLFYNSLSNSKQKSKNMKRTVRDHLPQNKMGNAASGKKCPQKQLPKSISKKQDLKRERLEQPLHPSWEASRKRQEQVSQITAFQGKRIKFED